MKKRITSYKKALRLVRIVMGFTLLAFGIALIVLPGPALIVIPLALAILAGEYVWARVLLKRMKHLMDRVGKAVVKKPESDTK